MTPKGTPVMLDSRYLSNEFKEFSYQALTDQFKDRAEFDTFLNNIKSKTDQAQFLRIASFYLFLVKKGRWVTDVKGANKEIDYLTHTYQYIGIFSLIESLGKNSFVDFFQYLTEKESLDQFPINTKEALEALYKKYKKSYGSIQKCQIFFDRVPTTEQESLKDKIKIENKDSSDIKTLSKYLYQIRSDFVHKAKLVLEASGTITISNREGKKVVLKLSMGEIMKIFEIGLLAHFNHKIGN